MKLQSIALLELLGHEFLLKVFTKRETLIAQTPKTYRIYPKRIFWIPKSISFTKGDYFLANRTSISIDRIQQWLTCSLLRTTMGCHLHFSFLLLDGVKRQKEKHRTSNMFWIWKGDGKKAAKVQYSPDIMRPKPRSTTRGER